uniref:MAK10-like protein n=1 Tax=Tanacetum cinerariifolium TaxID=118510 RepID=A0A6L2JAS4_TANCI|nr:MAK10-like protein [Tanacetum cinerariifolium]
MLRIRARDITITALVATSQIIINYAILLEHVHMVKNHHQQPVHMVKIYGQCLQHAYMVRNYQQDLVHMVWIHDQCQRRAPMVRNHHQLQRPHGEEPLQVARPHDEEPSPAARPHGNEPSPTARLHGDENLIRTLEDCSKPSHEGYRNTIELPVGNNVVPLRFDTIRLVQNGCSFHKIRSKDLNQHLKDFLKLMDSLDLDGDNRERTRLHLFQFSLRDQASNWLERLPAGSPPHGRILLLVSLLNSFHREGPQNSTTIS